MKKATAIRQNGKNAGIKIQSKSEKIFDAALNVFGVILVAIILYPIYYVFIASISRPLPVENGSVILAPVGVTLESYRQALKTPYLGTALLNSLYYTFGGVLVNMVFSTTMAYALSKKRLVGRKIFTLFTVFTMWFSAGIIPLYMTFRDFHMLNTRSAILFGFAMNTYNMIILKSFFEQVPESLEEAAFIDGASDFRIFSQIYLPLSKPALATVGLFYAVNRWNGYFWPMNLLTDDSKVPLQVLLKKLLVDKVKNEMESAIITSASLSSQTTTIYALIIIAIIPMAIVYPFVQKYFKTGLTIGANKG
ncbi:carbohydrate ABC transporter permease [Bullifex porci]|uniref:Carbohydrate ABC transporter permease n=1 Tax=Bullifex porci TaxID=2606638 RepID=A0A7X2TSA2_9SPIO|nr:carbohydrate ABC transporter permease [Bullifex porci]MDD7255014.1 carbohydrate ABC transporter permease [Bullifex porci]MDY2740619.1 carbohydrate ABC transporter permease [Bullifex porci]MSU06995.1 carbohydrate ABC transporter permease [Bullifex porci]